ncbi:MAG: DUF1015 domain-containing protein [Chloroflexota bacterium]
MPVVRQFRALRYSTEAVEDLAAVVAPPYDVIDPERHRALLDRDPRNVVRLDLPAEEPGDEPDDRYRRASRLLSAWRSDGTLRRDPRPALYAYEQTFRVPGGDEQLTRRGLFARVALESFGPDSGIRPHERTLAAPREDRYRLLRATGVNTSPVVGLYDEPSGFVAARLQAAAESPPTVDLVDTDGVRHRLWMLAATPHPESADPDGGAGETDGLAELCERIGANPITIADGHHRYETALRYRDERRTGPAAGAEAAYDDILMLLLEPVAGPILVLPTHRVVRGLGDPVVRSLRSRLRELFEVREAFPDELDQAFGHVGGEGGEGRFGLWTRDGGAILRARREAFEEWLPAGGAALRSLDVTLLGVALERLLGLDAADLAGGERIAYTKDAHEAMAWVDEGRDGADAAFLLDPTPPASILAVAAQGDVMPQKSTYIHPKALTGLVINPLE